jgi:hypothetical protein
LTLFTAVLAGYLSIYIKNKTFIVILALTILVTILNWGNRALDRNTTDTIIFNKFAHSTLKEEGWGAGIPVWRGEKGFEDKEESETISSLGGEAAISIIDTTTTSRTYEINNKSDEYFLENTWYFPGWSVYTNNSRVPIQPDNTVHPGAILFSLPEGRNNVKIVYKDIPIYSFVKNVSLMTFFLCILFLISAFIFKRRNNTADSPNI